MAFNSTIKTKPCKCGCGKPKKMGYAGYAGKSCLPEKLASLPRYATNKATNSYKAQILNKNSREVHNAQKENNQPKIALKSLMVKADEVFSRWVRNRDSVMGKVKCVCCGKVYGLKDKDNQGNTIIQNLHFVSRAIYSQRYSEFTCRAGCTWCNNDMDKNPTGLAYQQYRSFLVSETDEFTISQIENERYKVNRISHSDLETVIRKYSK